MKKIGRICGVIALLSPLWMTIIEQLNNRMRFSSGVHVILCLSTSVLCGIACIISIIVDVKEIKEEKGTMTEKNRKLVLSALVLGVVLLTILVMVNLC